METPIGDDEDSHLGDFIEDSTMQSPIEMATSESLKESTREVLAGLTAREAKVLRMRFGIDMNTDHPRGSRQAVRCDPRADPPDRSQGVAQLRHPSRSEHLRSFLDE